MGLLDTELVECRLNSMRQGVPERPLVMKEKCTRIGCVIQPYREATRLRGTDSALFSFQCRLDSLPDNKGDRGCPIEELGDALEHDGLSPGLAHVEVIRLSLEVTQLSITWLFFLEQAVALLGGMIVVLRVPISWFVESTCNAGSHTRVHDQTNSRNWKLVSGGMRSSCGGSGTMQVKYRVPSLKKPVRQCKAWLGYWALWSPVKTLGYSARGTVVALPARWLTLNFKRCSGWPLPELLQTLKVSNHDNITI